MYVCTIMLQRSHLQEVITMGLEMGTAEGNTHNKMNISYLTTSSKKKKASAQQIYSLYCTLLATQVKKKRSF